MDSNKEAVRNFKLLVAFLVVVVGYVAYSFLKGNERIERLTQDREELAYMFDNRQDVLKLFEGCVAVGENLVRAGLKQDENSYLIERGEKFMYSCKKRVARHFNTWDV